MPVIGFLLSGFAFQYISICIYMQQRTQSPIWHVMAPCFLSLLRVILESLHKAAVKAVLSDGSTLTGKPGIFPFLDEVALWKPLTGKCLFIVLYTCILLSLIILPIMTASVHSGTARTAFPSFSIISWPACVYLFNAARGIYPQQLMPNKHS